MLGRRKAKEEDVQENPPAQHATLTTPTTLREAPAPATHKHLGELLVDENLITAGQLQEALETQKIDGGFLGQILVKKEYVTQEAVASCLVKQCKIPHLSLLDYEVGQDVLSLVPEEVCRKYNLLPIDKLGRILTVAMVDPLDLEALEEVRRACPELRIKPILCNWEHYELVANKIFPPEGRGGLGGQRQITAESLGLGAAAPAPKAAAPAAGDDPFAKAAVDRAVNDLTRAESGDAPRAPAPAAGATAQEIAAAVSISMRDAMKDVVSALAERPAPAAGGIDPQALADAMKSSVQEAVTQLGAQIQTQNGEAAPVAAGPSTEELAGMIRDGVGGAMQEAMAAVLVQMRATAGAEKAEAPDMSQMAEVIRDSVGGAMQEGIAALVVHLRSMSGKSEGGVDPEALSQALRASMQESLAAQQQAQAEQNARLAQIAEATLQSVQQASLMHQDRDASETAEAPKNRIKLAASVAAFHTPGGVKVNKGDLVNPEERAAADDEVRASLETERPQETFQFESFLPGQANVFTYKLAQAVAANPGGDYNPFFLFGSVGLGKTHLINGMGNAILAAQPGLRVGYVSASLFSQRLADAHRAGAVDAFRENYCHWDVLILDDIQFLGGKVEAQEEFFHIFNVLFQAGRQIVIASDQAPDRLGLLEKRLVSRFASGIVAELKAPEWETRMEILRQRMAASGVEVPDEILSLVAMRVPGDVRKMSGSLRKVIAFADLVGQEMSCEMADEILSHLGVDAAA